MKIDRYGFITAFLISLFLSGCSLKEIQKPIREYGISAKNVKKCDLHTDKVLKISDLKSLSYLNSNKIWYEKEGNLINSYLYSEWSCNFNRLIQRDIFDAVYGSGIFATVFQKFSKIKPDLILEGEIIRAVQKIGPEAYVKFGVRLYLVDRESKKALSSKEFSYEEDCKSVDAKGAVEAYNKIVKKLNKDVILWLTKSIKAN